jgi:hypothetical protein
VGVTAVPPTQNEEIGAVTPGPLALPALGVVPVWQEAQVAVEVAPVLAQLLAMLLKIAEVAKLACNGSIMARPAMMLALTRSDLRLTFVEAFERDIFCRLLWLFLLIKAVRITVATLLHKP